VSRGLWLTRHHRPPQHDRPSRSFLREARPGRGRTGQSRPVGKVVERLAAGRAAWWTAPRRWRRTAPGTPGGAVSAPRSGGQLLLTAVVGEPCPGSGWRWAAHDPASTRLPRTADAPARPRTSVSRACRPTGRCRSRRARCSASVTPAAAGSVGLGERRHRLLGLGGPKRRDQGGPHPLVPPGDWFDRERVDVGGGAGCSVQPGLLRHAGTTV
jgi:hypothetical protein